MRLFRLLGLAGLFFVPAAFATDPAEADVTVPTNPSDVVFVEWTGTVLPGSSGAATNSCPPGDPSSDSIFITINVPEGTYDNVEVRADFHIEWVHTGDAGVVATPDLVLTVVEPEPDFTERSSDGGDPEENVSVTNPVEGVWEVQACPFANDAPTEFSGLLTLTAVSEDPNADSDGDGVPDSADFCPGTPEGTEVNEVTGCPVAQCEEAEEAPVAASSGRTVVDLDVTAEWSQLGRDAQYGAFVHFFDQGTMAQQDDLLTTLGLTKTHDFRRYTTAVFAEGPVWAFQRLVGHAWVSRIQYNKPLKYMDATQSWATRTRMAQEIISGGPYYDANGERLTGKGVTLGAMDSGLFGAHPDFAGRIVHNFKYAAAGYADVQEGDSENGGGGHGTHVTGILGGDGTMSDGGYPIPEVAPFIPGTFTSAAPEAGIMHWGHGAGLFVLNITAAYSHLLDNIATDTFQGLVAVNNSYGETTPGTPYNGNDADKQMVRRIIACGVNMVYAAGNDGGDGSADMTSSYCKDPTPGVICVGSYNDEGTGRLDGAMSGFSSRTMKGDPTKYVDIAAPGDLSASTCVQATPSQAICTGGDDSAAETEWQPWYGTISGTSMATPNVVGIIGVLRQAEPSLTPAETENLIQRTARKIGTGYEDDPQNPGSTIHFAAGAGLIDTQAALDDLIASGSAITRDGELDTELEWTVFDGDADFDVPESAADVIKLTMQNLNLDGVPGVMYRITTAGEGQNSPTIAYRIETFARGAPAFTTILRSADGVGIAEPGEQNNAVPTLVEIDGTLIRAFVPYSAMGYPPIDEPIHNVRVVVSNDSGVVDYAPSPANGTVGSDAGQPMYGRSFTTRLIPGLPPPSSERTCQLPGLTLINSPSGTTFTNSETGHDDLRQLWVAEPGDMPGKLVFTIKVDNLNPQPIANHRWYIYFNTPVRTDVESQLVAMDTVPPGGSSAIPGFKYGYRGTIEGPVAVGTFTLEGDLEDSSWDPDGTITLVLDKAQFGLETGMEITGIAVSIRQTSNAEQGSGLTVDSAGASGPYILEGNIPCPTLPVASLTADVTSGDAPLTVTFNGNGSQPAASGAAITEYRFDFGDGSAPVLQTTPIVEHVYESGGDFVASLTVVDEDGLESTNTAEVPIDVSGPGGGGNGGGGGAAPETNNRLGGTWTLPGIFALTLALAVRRRSKRAPE